LAKSVLAIKISKTYICFIEIIKDTKMLKNKKINVKNNKQTNNFFFIRNNKKTKKIKKI